MNKKAQRATARVALLDEMNDGLCCMDAKIDNTVEICGLIRKLRDNAIFSRETIQPGQEYQMMVLLLERRVEQLRIDKSKM